MQESGSANVFFADRTVVAQRLAYSLLSVSMIES